MKYFFTEQDEKAIFLAIMCLSPVTDILYLFWYNS